MFKVPSPGLLCSISGISEGENEDEEDENLEILVTLWKELPVLQQFNHWLISPDGKGKGTCQARQHVRQESSLRFFYKLVLCDDPKECAPLLQNAIHYLWPSKHSKVGSQFIVKKIKEAR